MKKITADVLKQRQALPLDIKIQMSKTRIKSWYNHWNGEVYVSFSGGKDSTVLLHLVRSMFPDVEAVFLDTGLEYPEIRDFVKTIDNVTWVKPKMGFKKVIEHYGYPVISKENAQKIFEIRTTKSDKLLNKRLHGDEKGYGKLSEKWKFMIDAPFDISHKCCDALKKRPVKLFEKESKKKPYVGTMAADSSGRKTSYLRQGCNSFESSRPMSTPIAFWLEEDIWDYIKQEGLEYADIYDKGYDRTGCMFCMFGVDQEASPNRFQRMKETHPTQHNYCINKLNLKEVLEFIGVKYE